MRSRLVGTIFVLLQVFFGVEIGLAATMQLEVTLSVFAGSRPQSFAGYRYHPDGESGPPQRYEQHHAIINGGVAESFEENTDVWSNNLQGLTPAEPPNCYNARVSIAVHSGIFSWCCTTAAYYYADAGQTCLYGPPPPEVVEPPPPDDPLQHTCVSPIIIDVDGDGYKLTSLEDGVSFDLRNEGQARLVAWTRANSGDSFLARDMNGNGAIDNGAELFGEFTRLQSGATARNGFDALRDLDGNGDRVVDSRDSAWSQLLLWTDRDHDGRSAADELVPLWASGVTTLDTDYHTVNRSDRWGNYLKYMSQLWRVQGSSVTPKAYYDVYLRIADH